MECLEFLKWKRGSFNSLQTGRCVASSPISVGSVGLPSQDFDSLQTGRCGQREQRSLQWNNWERLSIPFKREAGYKVTCKFCGYVTLDSFNSLQTGRHIQTENMGYPLGLLLLICFNSLQTGSRIQSADLESVLHHVGSVSIPFKREGIC